MNSLPLPISTDIHQGHVRASILTLLLYFSSGNLIYILFEQWTLEMNIV